MKKYEVISKITGKRNRTYQPGETITEAEIVPGSLKSLVSRGFIKLRSWENPISGPIKIAIVTSIWKRPEIVQLFMKGIHNLIEKCDQFEISLIMSGSLQDDDSLEADVMALAFKTYLRSEAVLDQNKFKFIEIPNEPLAAKVNATTYACRNLGVHYVMCMGSDDILSPELLNAYIPFMRRGIDFIGVTDGYFYDTVSGKSLYWGGYREQWRKGHTLGAFRALSARLLECWNWMPWENKDSHGLDKSMQDKLKITPHTIETFSMKSKGFFGLDIKSSTNMTPFAKWDNADFIDSEIIKKQFPYVFD